MVSQIQPGQDFIGQGHYGKVKGQIRSLLQGQRSNKGQTMMLHIYTPNQCPYQVSTSHILRFLRYSPDKIL